MKTGFALLYHQNGQNVLFHRQESTYHSLRTTSCGPLVETENSLQCRIDWIIQTFTGGCSTATTYAPTVISFVRKLQENAESQGPTVLIVIILSPIPKSPDHFLFGFYVLATSKVI